MQTKSVKADQFFLQEDAVANPERSLPPLPEAQLPKDSFSVKVTESSDPGYKTSQTSAILKSVGRSA